MSAIFGILRFDGQDADPRALDAMSSALRYRAQDGTSSWRDGPTALGHGLTRSVVRDAVGAQPLHDAEAGITVVADLRLDNAADLARALGIAPAALRGIGDAELLLRAYKAWGEDCARRLLGDFAFAIWNARTRKLLLGRDHLGQRHCFFHRGNRFFVFATDIKGLWAHPGVPRTLSDDGIGRVLMHDMSAQHGQTAFQGIEAVCGATLVGVDMTGALRKSAYWEPAGDPSHLGRSEAYYVDAYRHVLSEAVACRLRDTIAPAGLLLSGGFDSASIAALAAPVVTAQGRKLVAVNSSMPQDYRGPIRHSRYWAELCRRDMAYLDLRYTTREGLDFLAALPASFARTERPSEFNAVMEGELYRMLAGAGVRVVLDGYGGDQTLNPRGESVLAMLLAKGRLADFVYEFYWHRRQTGESTARVLKQYVLSPLLPAHIIAAWRWAVRGFVPAWRSQPVNREFARAFLAARDARGLQLRASARSRTDIAASMRYAIARRMTMGRSGALPATHGVELTQPFYDKRVVELALAIPPSLQVKKGRNRYLARRAMADLLPVEFQTRSRQNDHVIPDYLLQMKALEPRLLDDIARMEQSEMLARYIDFPRVRELLAARRADGSNTVWGEETEVAVGALANARFIEWFAGANR